VSRAPRLRNKLRANRSKALPKESRPGSFASDKKEPLRGSPLVSPVELSTPVTDTEARSDKTAQDNDGGLTEDQKTLEQAIVDGAPLLGQFHWVDQSRLHFGSNAKIPRRERPVMRALKRLGKWIPVLPTTTKTPAHHLEDFYPLAVGVVFYTDARGVTSGRYGPSYLYSRYETIRPKHLRREIGRIEDIHVLEGIRQWLIGRDRR